ncbi:MAG TPA: hypothetical protein VFY60_08075 [Pyrinomonadaceae bacterium]|nr:hypothetical protein [Pyrinomonadaceae bacterium]
MTIARDLSRFFLLGGASDDSDSATLHAIGRRQPGSDHRKDDPAGVGLAYEYAAHFLKSNLLVKTSGRNDKDSARER